MICHAYDFEMWSRCPARKLTRAKSPGKSKGRCRSAQLKTEAWIPNLCWTVQPPQSVCALFIQTLISCAAPQVFRPDQIEECKDATEKSGHFGCVRFATLIIGQQRKRVAVKRNVNSDITASDELKELRAFAGPPAHSNMVRFVGIVPYATHIDYVMELAEGGSLEDVLRDPVKAAALRGDDKRMSRLLHGILTALDHLHRNNFVHRDLASRKPRLCVFNELFASGNILLSSSDVTMQIPKLADWGNLFVLVASW